MTKQPTRPRRWLGALGLAAGLLGLSGCVTSERLLLTNTATGADGLPEALVVEVGGGPLGFFARDASFAFREVFEREGEAAFVVPGHHHIELWRTNGFAPGRTKLLHAACTRPQAECGYAMLVGQGRTWTQYVASLKGDAVGIHEVRDAAALKELFAAAAQRHEAVGEKAGLQVFDLSHAGRTLSIQAQRLVLRPSDAESAAIARAALEAEGSALAAVGAGAAATPPSVFEGKEPAYRPPEPDAPSLERPVWGRAAETPEPEPEPEPRAQPTRRAEVAPPPRRAPEPARSRGDDEAVSTWPDDGKPVPPDDVFGKGTFGGYGSLGGL